MIRFATDACKVTPEYRFGIVACRRASRSIHRPFSRAFLFPLLPYSAIYTAGPTEVLGSGYSRSKYVAIYTEILDPGSGLRRGVRGGRDLRLLENGDLLALLWKRSGMVPCAVSPSILNFEEPTDWHGSTRQQASYHRKGCYIEHGRQFCVTEHGSFCFCCISEGVRLPRDLYDTHGLDLEPFRGCRSFQAVANSARGGGKESEPRRGN